LAENFRLSGSFRMSATEKDRSGIKEAKL